MQKTIPLSELKHSPNNVRKVKPSDSGFKSLVASIQSKGLIHNLVCTKNGTGYYVIDGNRRLDALKALYDGYFEVNCIVVDDDDAELGLHANMMREDMHPLDECDAIEALCADGQETYDSVASRFGQTQKWVRQRLSLADLSEKAKEMFRDYKFNLGVAQALTLGSHERQDKYLESNDTYFEAMAKRAMVDSKIPVSACLFDYEAHRDVLGVESDLFGDEEFITNHEQFERLQNDYLFQYCEAARRDGYYDVVYAQDQYYWDIPEMKRCRLVTDGDDYDISEIILVVTYNSYTYSIQTKQMVLPETADATEAQKAEEEAEEEVTPLTFTGPQQQLVNAYFADHMIRQIVESGKLDAVKFFKALLCHRKLGYSGTHIHRIGNIYADPQNLYSGLDEPDGITALPLQDVIDNHKSTCQSQFESGGDTPLMYCYNLPDEKLDELFVASCLQGLSRTDFQSEAMQDFNTIIDPQKWFKPDSTWVNKWKVNQLEMVEQWLYGGAKAGNKSDRVEKITESLQEGRFDPYGDWPQTQQS